MRTIPSTLICLALLGATSVAQEKQERTTYDEKAVAGEQIAAALAKAKKENRRVLIQWGANWCGWCHLLHDKMSSDRELKRKLSYEYDVVLVDIGRGDKNRDLAEKYGATLASVPYLTILDADGEVVVNTQTERFEVKGKEPDHDARKLVAFLAEHQAEYRKADSVLEDGLAEAKSKDKRVFLHFGAPWCGWCHRLEDWMARDDVQPLLAEEFIDVKIDIDRTVGGNELLKRYRGDKSGGIPWFVFLEPSGEPVVDSNDPGGKNLGCPWTDDEIAAFEPILRQACRSLTDEQVGDLIAALKKHKRDVEGK